MENQNKIIKKVFFFSKVISLIILLFLLFAIPIKTRALSICFLYIGCSTPDSTEFYKEIEDRYGFTQDDWRKAKRKVSAPRVEISFDNTNPKEGEKVTAHAIPEFFKNDPQNLYYTWYIIHTKDGTPQTATNSLDGGKKEAARLMIHGDYDPALDDQSYSNKSEDPDKDGWPAVDPNSYDENKTAAPMGGADGVGGLSEENVESYGSGDAYCRGEYGNPDETKCNYYGDTSDESAYVPTTSYYLLESSSSNSQTNHWCSQCWDTNHTLNATCSSTRNTCCHDVVTGDPYDSATDYCALCASPNCNSCYETYKSCNLNNVSSCIDGNFNTCKSDWEESHTSTNEEIYVQVSRCYRHKFGEPHNETLFLADDSSGLDYPVECKHKWLNAPGYKSGSGKFPTGEEEYWGSNPYDPDTDGDGFPDEADVIGLGQESFTWNYAKGDRVGVVVEGTSMLPTDEKNAYYKIMWGYPDVCDKTKTGLLADDQCEDSDDYGYGFLATKSPSEEFSEEKLEISLSFSPENPIADPTSDETIAEADQIEVISSLDNTALDPSNLYYSWYIQKEDSGSSTGWGSKLDIGGNFDTSSPSSGMGASDFKFKPKKDFFSGESGDIVKIKVTLATSRTALATDVEKDVLERKTPRRGYASVVIPINRNGVRLALHKVNIENGKAIMGEEVCNEGLYKTLCPAVKGQMLAATVTSSRYKSSNTEFSWTLNENQWNPPADYGKLFDGWSSTAVFFPIISEEQEIESISVAASPKDKLQPVMGGRLITVVRPALFIKTMDESTSWPMKYTVPDETRKDASRVIISSDMFEALISKQVSHHLDFVPDYLLKEDYLNTSIDWKFNGTSTNLGNVYEENPDLQRIDLEDNDRTIKFTTSELEGRYYTLGAEIKKYWSEDEKNILSQAWGIYPETLKGETGATIATVAAKNEETAALGNPKQILAAIGTHLPHYLMYNLRLALTVLVMFFASAGFYALSQRLSLKK